MSNNDENPHSFIQIFNENSKKSAYLTFGLNEFKYDNSTNTVAIGSNKLSVDQLIIKTDDIEVKIQISKQLTLGKYKGSKSAMGYLKNAPLECFQEVIYMNATATGYIKLKEKHIDINGTAYMEKTYGTNFPKKWIWIQSNVEKSGALISFSVGKIPVLKFTVNGFLALLKYENKLYRFSSYNFSKIYIEEVEGKVVITISKGKLKLIIMPSTNKTVELVGPRKNGVMDLPVFESLNSSTNVVLLKSNIKIFEGEFLNTGYEQMYFIK